MMAHSKIILQSKITAEAVASEIKAGKVVAIATDTVYGLIAILDENVQRLNKIKRRETQKPLGIFVPNVDCIPQ